MVTNMTFELFMMVDGGRFKKILGRVSKKAGYLEECEEGYIDYSMTEKGMTVVYRDSKYKKNVRLAINLDRLMNSGSIDGGKLIRKLDKRITLFG